MVITFFTAFEIDQKIEDMPQAIVFNYIKGYFIFDFFACIPALF
jgi:hypothetical protein